jgi:acyl-CoA reductase-like NAD-dependent aldehyde dehydrogenase
MMKFHALVRENAQELAELMVKENGKNITEALADGKIAEPCRKKCIHALLSIPNFFTR